MKLINWSLILKFYVVPLRVVAVAAIIYTLTAAILGFMRLSTVPPIQQICAILAARTQEALRTDAKGTHSFPHFRTINNYLIRAHRTVP
jgi:hypothetical protein